MQVHVSSVVDAWAAASEGYLEGSAKCNFGIRLHVRSASMDPGTIKETHVPLPHIPANLLLTPGGCRVAPNKHFNFMPLLQLALESRSLAG